MILKDDVLNHLQLLDACLPALLDKYIEERLHLGHNVWPIEDASNALVVMLFLHVASQGVCDYTSPPSF
jgi:hypothetical protein